MKICYIHEPTDLQCGQAVLAMLLGEEVGGICQYLENERETTLSEMKKVLKAHGVAMHGERRQVQAKEELPSCALLSLETPRCWHWSLYFEGQFFDPEHGILDDFPQSARRYYWKIDEHTLPI